jgi:hypothetical protein
MPFIDTTSYLSDINIETTIGTVRKNKISALHSLIDGNGVDKKMPLGGYLCDVLYEILDS